MSSLKLVTVFPIQLNEKRLTKERIQKLLNICLEDDVFSTAFLENVVFNSLQTGKHSLDEDARNLIIESGAKTIKYTSISNLVPGPHVILNGKLREVFRLMDDSHATCMVTLKPQQDPSSAFEPLSIIGQQNNVCFAIPSRIKHTIKYSPVIKEFPLAGKRILIKDNIHLNGIKTSNGSRAFYETYPEQTKDARCIRDLIDKGAKILGKTKMSSLGSQEEQYADYQAPWNPRADSYQSPGGGSSGSAAAIAAYDWLDIAIGTDTWGDVTRPAHRCGCFGLRPSIGAISSEGIQPCVQSFDVPGILAKDLKDCKEIAEHWLKLDDFENNPQPFSSIIWPIDFWKERDDQRKLAKEFAQKMAEMLSILFEEVSFEERWIDSRPSAYNEPSMTFMQFTAFGLTYDMFHNIDDFRSRYKELHGHEPYVPVPNQRAQSIPETTRNTAFERIAVYRQWFKQSVWAEEHANAMIVLPLDLKGSKYRDMSSFSIFPIPPGNTALGLGPVMNAPVLAVPIGHIRYDSRVSGQEEKLPCTVALMGKPGTDMKLTDTAIFAMDCLGIPTAVKTGRSIKANPYE